VYHYQDSPFSGRRQCLQILSRPRKKPLILLKRAFSFGSFSQPANPSPPPHLHCPSANIKTMLKGYRITDCPRRICRKAQSPGKHMTVSNHNSIVMPCKSSRCRRNQDKRVSRETRRQTRGNSLLSRLGRTTSAQQRRGPTDNLCNPHRQQKQRSFPISLVFLNASLLFSSRSGLPSRI
jgi:hypothetical protein